MRRALIADAKAFVSRHGGRRPLPGVRYGGNDSGISVNVACLYLSQMIGMRTEDEKELDRRKRRALIDGAQEFIDRYGNNQYGNWITLSVACKHLRHLIDVLEQAED